ncbi:hypothetical protein D9757_006093 [Collybiopsis confluens]|uniref:Uncharacterized protein n=1 Tax=Collybiopsis confluens TaxID=2823264 RepID=A0A8H5HH96_9AGAR|nr:hypothetical protein D9757_006093 [Collybiopsis confluens]
MRENLSPSSTESSRQSRASVLPSAVLPYLRRLDTAATTDPLPPVSKPALLVFSLSNHSFLDSQVKDDRSRLPLYSITTRRTHTQIIRSDPLNGDTKTAEIQWPVLDPSKGKGKELDGVTIQVRGGRRKPASTFLRPSSILSAPRKFKIPGYSHSLKWKAVGSSYWCIAASAKGPIAILEPAVDSYPTTLKVFETLHDKYDVRPMMVHQSVSVLLLDYLLLSALLLITDIQEWMVVQRYQEDHLKSTLTSDVAGPEDFAPKSAPPASTSASALQWRKIIYGDPIYPKRQSSASTASHHNFPTQASRMAKILNGDPIYPTLRRPSSSSTDLSFSSDSESEEEEEEEEEEERAEADDAAARPPPTPPRAPSPSAESVLYPLTTASAPSHTYLDPSFYNEYGVPPVPPLPAEYALSNGLSSPRPPTASGPRPTSASGPRRARELPRPPAQNSLSHRSRSSPPRSIPMSAPSSPVDTRAYSPDRRRPSIDSMLSRSGSMRTLPRPPPTPIEASSSHPPLRHSQSSSRPLNGRTREKRSSQYAQRTLPPTPTAVSNPDWMAALRIRKRSHIELARWYNDLHEPANRPPDDDDNRESTYEALDCPPPPYHSLEFSAGTSLSDSPSPPPIGQRDLQEILH